MSLLELAAAASHAAHDDGDSLAVAVLGATMSNTLKLQKSVPGCCQILECTINTVTCAVDVASSSGSNQAPVKHLAANLAVVMVRWNRFCKGN